MNSLYLKIGHGHSDAEIEAMKQARFDAWYAIVTTPVEIQKLSPRNNHGKALLGWWNS